MKTVAVISDLHCGAAHGLTPYKWQTDDRIQDAMWSWYCKEAKKLGSIDLLVVLGDAIDGKGDRSGGCEQITVDRRDQIIMAKECIEQFDAKKVIVIAGTPYHTGNEEDWERVLADSIGANFSGHEFVDADGVIFDLKHKVGSSSIPHGRHTAIARENLWNALWNERGVQPRANIILRGHVHYHAYCGQGRSLCATMPALQVGSYYGVRQCSGIIDVGFLSFVCTNGDFEWTPHMLELGFIKQEAIVV